MSRDKREQWSIILGTKCPRGACLSLGKHYCCDLCYMRGICHWKCKDNFYKMKARKNEER